MKSSHRFASTVAAVALTATGVFAVGGGVDAKGGDAAQNVSVAADCGGVGSASAGYNKSGARVTLVFQMQSAPTGTSWQVSADDNGVSLYSTHLDAIGGNWSLVHNFDSPKGRNTVTLVADADDGSQHCVATLTYRV